MTLGDQQVLDAMVPEIGGWFPTDIVQNRTLVASSSETLKDIEHSVHIANLRLLTKRRVPGPASAVGVVGACSRPTLREYIDMEDGRNTLSASESTRPSAPLPRNGSTLVALNFRVPFELRQRVKLAAITRDMTVTELLSAALEKYLQLR
jgi:hypothetical protein